MRRIGGTVDLHKWTKNEIFWSSVTYLMMFTAKRHLATCVKILTKNMNKKKVIVRKLNILSISPDTKREI